MSRKEGFALLEKFVLGRPKNKAIPKQTLLARLLAFPLD